MRLLEVIESSPNRNVLVTESDRISKIDLLNWVYSWRNSHEYMKNNIMTLCVSKPTEVIKTIIALDGFASFFLLLPHNTTDEIRENLISKSNSSFIIFDNDIKEINANNDEFIQQNLAENTQWILTTSGTTGNPKLIYHSLDSLTAKINKTIDKSGTYKWGLLYDPARFAGLQVVLQCIYSGSPLIVSDNASFDAQIELLIKEDVNALSATPTLWRKLLMDGRIKSLNFKQITLGGEIADQSILNSLKKYFPQSRITHIYASTEAGASFSVNDGLAGFPADWLENAVRVQLKLSESHNLMIKPYKMASGEEILNRLDQDGFLDTGDKVEVKNERVYFLGRATGTINVGGNKVHPEEIEGVIREINGVDEVKVYGKKSGLMGELVAADVVKSNKFDKHDLKNKILKKCKDGLPAWKQPVLIKFVENIEGSAAGKIER